MRTLTIQIFKYDELPTDKAKEKPVHKALESDPDTPAEDLRRVAIAAVWEACKADQESKQETDYLEDMIRGNDYEFTADGKRYVEAKA